MKRICVFCGANSGKDRVYEEAARALGRTLVERRLGVVYGGGNSGLMGALANAVLEAGGEIIGIMPRGLVEREHAHEGLTELRIVESMHERKALMSELSDGFVAMPGGLGTLEELSEVITWAQLGIHGKPCGLLNVAGYWDDLLRSFDHFVEQGFVQPLYRTIPIVEREPAELLAALGRWEPLGVRRWLDADDI